MLRAALIILLALGLSNCGKEAIKDEPISKAEPKTEVTAPDTTQILPEVHKVPEAPAPQTDVSTKADTTVKTTETRKVIQNKSAEETAVPAPAPLDSVKVQYMIRPNDYLVKIAINEYGRPTMWRKIWNWNRKAIGENPNLIYPYREISLLKPVEYAVKTEFEYYDYVVKKDDTLWSIAKKEYGNNLAWIVILRDNYDSISEDYDHLKENTVLKLRTKLY